MKFLLKIVMYFIFFLFVFTGIFTSGVWVHEYIHYIQHDGEVMQISWSPISDQVGATYLNYNPSSALRNSLEFTAYFFQFLFVLLMSFTCVFLIFINKKEVVTNEKF